MSHHALQRALVVALHDPEFVVAMHRDPASTLAPFGIDEAARRQLLAVDRRAFGVDRLRRRRVLKAIVEELKASIAIALAETRTFATAEGFFSSPAFREAVARDRPLVLALADHLTAEIEAGRLTSPHLTGVLAIERARAECRRDVVGAPPAGISLAPGLRLVTVDTPALAALQAAEQHLFEIALVPHLALCDDRPLLALPPAGPGEPLHLAIRAAGGEVSLDEVPEPLHRSLAAVADAAARGVVQRADIPGILARVNLRVPDPAQLVDDLLAEGTLVEGG